MLTQSKKKKNNSGMQTKIEQGEEQMNIKKKMMMKWGIGENEK